MTMVPKRHTLIRYATFGAGRKVKPPIIVYLTLSIANNNSKIKMMDCGQQITILVVKRATNEFQFCRALVFSTGSLYPLALDKTNDRERRF